MLNINSYLTRYKECSPHTTISHIQSLLAQHNIEVEETKCWNDKQINAPKSVSIKLLNIPLLVNGKGVSALLARASAYAELMERLQNISFLAPSLFLNKKEMQHVLPPDRTLDGTIKYFCVNTQSIEYLPESLLLSTGSNGMCAGNTVAEALIQGLCEIMERIVLKKLYRDDIEFLPTIPLENFKNTLYEKYIEFLHNYGYQVTIKDCSLNEGYPVVGLFLTKGKAFRFNLGAAPDFYIALERCFTEIFQGKNANKLTEFLITKEPLFLQNETQVDYWERQLRYSLTQYAGNLKPNLLENTKTISLSEVVFSFKGAANKDTLINLLNLFLSKNKQVYIRDTSFLGFPTFHIFVPGDSNIVENLSNNYYLAKFEEIADTLLQIHTAHHDKLRELIKLIEYLLFDKAVFLNDKSSKAILSKLLKIPPMQVGNKINIQVLRSLLHYYINEKVSAIKILTSEINQLASSKLLSLKKIMELKYEGFPDHVILNSLSKNSAYTSLEELLLILDQPILLSNILREIKDSYKKDHLYDFLHKIHFFIKRYNFDQENLRSFFAN